MKKIIPVLFLIMITGFPHDVCAKEFEVVKVIDGSTIKVSDGRTLRLIGINAASEKLSTAMIEQLEELGISIEDYRRMASEATAFLDDFLKGKALRLEVDPIYAQTFHHDARMHFLTYLYADDQMVNGEMIRRGYAYVNTFSFFRYKEDFLHLQKEAQAEGRGFWKKRSSE
ncbi:MAG: thermonuclease family protein [Candidatus Omnitrophica bacterium]|nr:thermonuclease family protein [Candidatus Omnitrophota bacterium]